MYSNILQFILIIASFNGTMPPQPTEEIKNLITNLGHERYKEREKATQKLIDLKYAALAGCLTNKTNADPEISLRCERIIETYFTRTFQQKKFPSIYLLENSLRFPLGIKYEEMDDNWCTNFETPLDIAVFYVKKAIQQYNQSLDSQQIRYGGEINCWWVRHEEIESLAMKLFVRDLMYFGINHEQIISILEYASDKDNLYIYSTTYPNPPGPVYKKKK